MRNGVLIPKFYLVSTDPDRVNTEDYLRKNLDLNTFYRADPLQLKHLNLSETTESPRLCVPKRRIQAEVPVVDSDRKPQCH
jgi:hypothetical protein